MENNKQKKARRVHSHNGINSIDYYAYASRLRDVNPSYKSFISALTIIICILADRLWVSLFVTVSMAFAVIVLGRLNWRSYLSFIAIPLVFMAMGSAAIAVDIGKLPLGDWNLNMGYFYFCVSVKSIIRALSVSAKALGAVSAMLMLALSTPVNEIIVVLGKMHVPKLIIELMNMIYRFIFILLDVQCKINVSAESRLGYKDFKTSVKTFGSVAGNLLVLSLKKAGAYYDALEARCYEGELMFLENRKRLESRQIFCGVIYLLALLIIWRYAL